MIVNNGKELWSDGFCVSFMVEEGVEKKKSDVGLRISRDSHSQWRSNSGCMLEVDSCFVVMRLGRSSMCVVVRRWNYDSDGYMFLSLSGGGGR